MDAFNMWIGFIIILSFLYGYLSLKVNKKYFISITLTAIWIYSYGLFDGELINSVGYIYVVPVAIFICPVVWVFIETKIKK